MCAQIVAVSCGLYFRTFFKNEFSLSRSDKKKMVQNFASAFVWLWQTVEFREHTKLSIICLTIISRNNFLIDLIDLVTG